MLYILRLAASTFQRTISPIFHFLTGNYFLQMTNTNLTTRTMTNIVILGASFAGLSTAHRILKQAAKAGVLVKITLLSPNTDFYWNIAAPRALVPGQLSDDRVFQPISTGFRKYTPSQFEFIVASAESLDVVARKVVLSTNVTINYDFLILATGSSVKEGTPLKTLESTEATKDALHDFQARVKQAETIVIAGAGATGVEIAGELGFEYRQQKKIILVGMRHHENLRI